MIQYRNKKLVIGTERHGNRALGHKLNGRVANICLYRNDRNPLFSCKAMGQVLRVFRNVPRRNRIRLGCFVTKRCANGEQNTHQGEGGQRNH